MGNFNKLHGWQTAYRFFIFDTVVNWVLGILFIFFFPEGGIIHQPAQDPARLFLDHFRNRSFTFRVLADIYPY